ncbi:hypothetical protein DdX_19023 [Ditylenchus destructor]|uniref:SH2 domain-containing protein n=1 Tax=Ditylenchus destructor TaxID=166010 RepID=A0AAD4QXL4_9BILA|nr:hypothetical protein DdX_19023 [Ditylenchus destructor]
MSDVSRKADGSMRRKSGNRSHKTKGSVSPPSYRVEEDQDGFLVNKNLPVVYPAYPKEGRYSLKNYQKKMQHSKRLKERTVSPPTYRVEEDKDGYLVNKELKVVYPAFPKKGRYSLKSYLNKLKRAKKSEERPWSDYRSELSLVSKTDKPRRSRSRTTKHQKVNMQLHYKNCRCSCGHCCCSPLRNLSLSHRDECQDFSADRGLSRKLEPLEPSVEFDWDTASQRSVYSDRSVIKSKRSTIPIPENLKNTFIGAKSEEEIETMLQPTQFYLYYRRPRIIESIDDVPLSEPLMIAYKSHDNIVSHFPLRLQTASGNVRMWRVDLGPKAKEQPGFYSLNKLVQYYKTFAVTNNDAVEFFQG